MRAKVRYVLSLDRDLDTVQPDDPRDIGVAVEFTAGPSNGPGEDTFAVFVCTPRWLERYVRGRPPIVGRHYLIVEEFDWPTVQKSLTKIVESERADTWQELAQRIGRVGAWEFEDYQPSSASTKTPRRGRKRPK